MTHSYMWHDSFICVTWLIHMCDITHSQLTWTIQGLNNFHLLTQTMYTRSIYMCHAICARDMWLVIFTCHICTWLAIFTCHFWYLHVTCDKRYLHVRFPCDLRYFHVTLDICTWHLTSNIYLWLLIFARDMCDIYMWHMKCNIYMWLDLFMF